MMDIVDSHSELRPGLEICGMPYAEFREDIFRLLSNLEHGAERINNTVTNLKEFVTSEEKPEFRPTDPREVI